MVDTSIELFPMSFALLLPKSFHHIDTNSIILAHVIHDAQKLLLKNIFLSKTLLCIWVAVNFNLMESIFLLLRRM